jgi:galactokinase
MDQAIAIMGQAGRALLLDCRFGTTRQIPFDNPNLRLLVVDTKVKHENSDGGYAARRQQCEAAAQELAVKALRDADEEMLSSAASDARLPHLNHRRARHVVREIRRTLRAAEVLEAGDYRTFGELMYESHASLRDDYEVSCAELDEVVEIARTCPGVYGARMTGGGFGGCAIILAEAAAADAVSQKVASGFLDKFGHACPIFATAAAAGASVLE